MNSATLKPLRELLDVQSGFAFKKENFSESRGVPLIRIRDLESDTTETMYDGPFREDFLVEPGDYLIGMDGEFRCHIWRGPQALLNQRVCRLRNFRPEVEPRYIYYGIQKYLKDIEEHTPFATVKHISGRQIENIVMPVPDLEGQRHAIDVLSRAENIVRMRREAEQKAKEIIPALFLDMFGDPARNAKGWEKKTIGDLCSYSRYGPRFPDREYLPGGAHILRTTDMDDFGAVRWWEAPKLPMESAELEKYALKAPTLLVTRSGTIGRVALFNGSDEPCIAGAYLIELGLKAGVSPEYVLHFFLSECGQKVLIGGARGVTQVNLNAPTIMAIHIPMPPPSLQEQFVRRAAQLQALSDVQKRATLVATASFEALVAGVFQQ